MTWREWFLGVGIVLAGLGLVGLVQPGLLGVSVSDRTPAMVAAVALALAAYRGYRWVERDADPPLVADYADPEGATVPGDAVDTLLAQVPAITSEAGDRRALKTRQDLRRVAVDVLVAYRGLEESEARDQLDAGTWTDDALAAEFFAKLDGTSAPISESVAESIRDRSPFERRAERAVAELSAIAAEEDDG